LNKNLTLKKISFYLFFLRLIDFFRTFAPMKEVKIKNSELVKAAEKGLDEFLDLFVNAIKEAIGGELNAETMAQLNSDQITLLGYDILRSELMDGGFIQLIHNGYGPFFFRNPFGKAVRQWGLDDLARMIRKANDLYRKTHEDIERDCDDEQFMALYEQFPKYDDFDDEFVENEERWSAMIAYYIDEHIDNFATVLNNE